LSTVEIRMVYLPLKGRFRRAAGVPGEFLTHSNRRGSLVLSEDGSFRFAANAGSGTITSLRVVLSGLTFVGEVNSGGEGPISITTYGDLLYVLNIANLTGFRIQGDGSLIAILSSTHFLETVRGKRPWRLRHCFQSEWELSCRDRKGG
jgi:hypothetical protein